MSKHEVPQPSPNPLFDGKFDGPIPEEQKGAHADDTDDDDDA